jgi:hypothetical protein
MSDSSSYILIPKYYVMHTAVLGEEPEEDLDYLAEEEYPNFFIGIHSDRNDNGDLEQSFSRSVPKFIDFYHNNKMYDYPWVKSGIRHGLMITYDRGANGVAFNGDTHDRHDSLELKLYEYHKDHHVYISLHLTSNNVDFLIDRDYSTYNALLSIVEDRAKMSIEEFTNGRFHYI